MAYGAYVERSLLALHMVTCALAILPMVASTTYGVQDIVQPENGKSALRGIYTQDVHKKVAGQPQHPARSENSLSLANSSNVEFIRLKGNQSAWDTTHASFSRSATNKSVDSRIFFLFMTRAGLVHEELWQAFFSSAPQSNWRAFIHCVNFHTCSLHFQVTNPMGMTLVPTTTSEYCKNLVSPMIQLVSYAIRDSSSSWDKFVFLSETTLPVKPFSSVYTTLMNSMDSDICVAPANEWGILTNSRGESVRVVKHSQWIVLNAQHAQKMVDRWPEAQRTSDHWRVPLWPETNGMIARISRDMTICADEWFPMALIYGLIFADHGELIPLQNFGPWNSLRLHGGNIVTNAQGNCRTWVGWGHRTNGTNVGGDAIMHHPGIHIDCHNGCTGSHPINIKYVTDGGLAQFKHSEFMFARKFMPGSVSPLRFRRIVLSDMSASSA